MKHYPSIDDDVKKKLDPFLLCEKPYTVYVKIITACLEKQKFEYYHQEQMQWIDDSHRTIEQDSFFMEPKSWTLLGGGGDFTRERTFKGFGAVALEDEDMLNFQPDLYLDFTKKRVSEVREPEDYLVGLECREMLEDWTPFNVEYEAMKEAFAILKYKKALISRRHPSIWAYMKTLDVEHPLWLLFCYMDEVSFFLVIEELKDTYFFPPIHKLRVYKIFDLLYHVRQLFKDPYLKKVQEDKFKKRHRSKKKELKRGASHCFIFRCRYT